MNIIHIPLAKILPNPYQSREREDPVHVRKLALSIAKDGLMQFPMGRVINAGGLPALMVNEELLASPEYRVQLAFGHSRLSAFRWLVEYGRDQGIAGDWSRMPVNLQNLTDEEMFRRGIQENIERKELTPIEQAKAMLVYREQFKKTSVEIGELFGLSDSAVRNKMRLLGLPEALQDALRAGEITEGVGRALLPLYDLSAAKRQEAEEQEGLKPSEVVEAARSGISPDKVTELVLQVLRRMAKFEGEQPELPIQNLATEVTERDEKNIKSVSTETVLQPFTPYLQEMGHPAVVMSAPAPSVSTETLLPDEQEDVLFAEAHEADIKALEQTYQEEMVEAPAEEVVEEAQEAPAPAAEPVPTSDQPAAEEPRPAAVPPTNKPATSPTPAAPAVTPSGAPGAAPEPAKVLNWDESTVTITLTFWPIEKNMGVRQIMLGGRVNQGTPRMQMMPESALKEGLYPRIELMMEGLRKEIERNTK